MLEAYQNLPLELSPNVFTFGGFAFTWYAASYLAGLSCAWLLVWFFYKQKGNIEGIGIARLTDFLLFAFMGGLLGGRLGFVVFYEPAYYLQNPTQIFWPFEPGGGAYVGIRGMSFFGAVLGAGITTAILTKGKWEFFWRIWSLVAPAIPLGYFWGRIGNFINGELYGMRTSLPWGMYFAVDPEFLRHPTQLYEAFCEGLVLLCWLFYRRRKNQAGRWLIFDWMIGYAVIRFFMEFLREQATYDTLGFLSKGQWLALCLLAGALFWRHFLMVSGKNVRLENNGAR